MRRPICRRRGGALPATAGFLGIGVSATLLVMFGSRVLSAEAFSGLFVAWTITNTFGFGGGTPTEQVISRRLNVGAPDPVRGPLRRMAAVGLIAGAVTVLLGFGTASGRAYPYLIPAASLAIMGWVAVVYVRGRIAGAGDLLAYGVVLGTEAVLRALLIVAAMIAPGAAGVLLGASVAVPLLAAAALGAVFVVPAGAPGTRAEAETTVDGASAGQQAGEQAGFMAVSIGYQVCLQAAVLLLGWRLPESRQAVVGAFGAVNSYFRTPTVLMGGITTHALVALSHAWGAGDLAGFRAALRRALRDVALVGMGGTVLVGAAAPVLLPIYYPHPLDLPLHLFAALAVSTVAATFGTLMIQPLLAAGRVRGAALAWGGGGVATVALFAVSGGTDVLASVAILVGPVAALLVALLEVRRTSRAGAFRQPVPSADLH